MTKNKSRMVAAGSVFTLVAAAVGISIIGGGAADAQEAAQTVPTAMVAANSVNSTSIVNGGIYQADINTGVVNVLRTPGKDSVTGWTVKDGTVTEPDLSTAVKAKLNDKSGQFTGLESDSPYPGATKLQDNEGEGANSTEKWIGDGGKTLQTSWVQCADGKVAIGAGYDHGDEGVAAFKNLQVVAVTLTQIKDGKEVYEPIKGDKAGSLVPNAVRVQGFNNGDTDLIVRPTVTCANVG
jgi:hypothetical protein